MDTTVASNNDIEKKTNNKDSKELPDDDAVICRYPLPGEDTKTSSNTLVIRNSSRFRFFDEDGVYVDTYVPSSVVDGKDRYSIILKRLHTERPLIYPSLSRNIKGSESLPARRHVFSPYELRKKLICACYTKKRSVGRWSLVVEDLRLQTAATTNNVEYVSKLLAEGVNPDCQDNLLRTPLHLAACRGYTDIVRLLLESGADPNKKDSLGNTPLHLAACTNHVEVVTLLLKAGTDVQSNDHYGRNPLQLAQSKLKLLQRGTLNDDSQKIKEEVKKVIDMMMTFLHKKGQDTELELLTAFQTRLNLSQTKEQVETDVRDLLTSLDNLNLNKEASQ